MPEQRGAGEPRDELGDEPLAAEEDVGVVDVERGEALERADDDARAAAGRLGGARAACSSTTRGGEVVLGGGQPRALAAARSAVASSPRGRPRRGASRGRRAWTRRGRPSLSLDEPGERCGVAVRARDRGDGRVVERAERQVRVRGGLDRRGHELRPSSTLAPGAEQVEAPGVRLRRSGVPRGCRRPAARARRRTRGGGRRPGRGRSRARPPRAAAPRAGGSRRRRTARRRRRRAAGRATARARRAGARRRRGARSRVTSRSPPARAAARSCARA